ncbi:MAG: hypothetical protein AB7K24_27960 [Gemmataceae bacterium]
MPANEHPTSNIQHPTSNRGSALVLFVPGRGGGSVACACDRALARGVRPGLPLAEARALLDEHACFTPLDAAACRAALVRLAVWCQQFSPVVGLEEAELPECLLLDVTGCATLFKGEAKLLERAAAAFRARGLFVRLALADTSGAAWGVAHFVRRDSTLVHPGLHEQALRPLPVEALRLPAETVRRLRDLDLCRVELVQALPRASLPARFGPELLCRLDQATGERPEPIRAVPATEPVEVHRHFDYPLRERRLLATIVHEVLAEAVARVAARGQAVSRVVCRFEGEMRRGDTETRGEMRRGDTETRGHGDGVPAPSRPRVSVSPCPRVAPCSRPRVSVSPCPRVAAHLRVALLEASVSLPRLWELVHLQLERAVLPAEVWRVRLRVAAAPLISAQETFFDAETQRSRRALASLLERLTSRLGKSAVLHARPSADVQPEFAVGYQPALEQRRGDTEAGRRGDAGTRKVTSRATHYPSPRLPLPVSPRLDYPSPCLRVSASDHRPLHLEPRPQAVAALSVVPDGPPIRFYWQGEEHSIVQSWGPERLETGWWRQRYVRRDYYRVETSTGQRFWLYRRLDDGQWFVHGCFE